MQVDSDRSLKSRRATFTFPYDFRGKPPSRLRPSDMVRCARTNQQGQLRFWENGGWWVLYDDHSAGHAFGHELAWLQTQQNSL